MIPGHPLPVESGHCSMCSHWVSCGRYRELWERFNAEKKMAIATGPARTIPQPVATCEFLGRALTQLERERDVPGLPGAWRICHKGFGAGSGAVCECRDCGPGCSGYSAE